jgi:DNA invertase Pin-like site-specific DNA recombinase
MSNDYIPAATSQFARCAFYGRYSTNMQRPASLLDQERVCRDFAAQNGWIILDEHIYTDAALSGTTKAKRKRLEALEAAAQKRPRPFDYVLFDDTSRLSRDLAAVLEFEKLMRHFGIKIRFVSQQLDSNDPNFQMLLTMYGMVDSQYSARLATKVHSSQKGRVLAGFSAGSWPYGYRSVIVASANSAHAVGRATSEGTILEVVERDAEVIRRIFRLFTDGYSMWNIAVKLNLEKVPSPHNARSGMQNSEWGRDAIKRILHNEKYRGVNVWNQTTQLEHPITGQITKEYKPAHEHVRVSAPHYRIVSDELWDQAAARLKQLDEKQEARRLGGYNRAKSQQYLYSGLLFCGCCGSRMKIGGKGERAVYECPNHRLRRGCINNLRIRQDKAAAQITEVLANQLFAPEYLTYLVSAVFRELKEIWKTQSQQTPGEGIHEFEQAHRACKQKVDNLVDLIEVNPSQVLMTRLAANEFEMQRLEDKLRILKGTKKLNVTEEELQAHVRENVANLLDVLKAEVPLARKVLQQHVKRLLLFPGEFEKGRVLEVVGELDLFSGPRDPEAGVLLGCSDTQTPQQHTDRYYRFTFRLHPDFEDCLLVEPLCQLLLAQPELSLESRRPGAWAKLLRGALAGNSNGKPVGYGTVGRCFGRHRHALEQRLNIIKTTRSAAAGWHYKLSIRQGTCTADDEFQRIQGGLPSITGAEAVTHVAV